MREAFGVLEPAPLVTAFGLRAAALAPNLPRAGVIVADPSGAVDAMREAVRRRRAGSRFAIAPIVEDLRTLQAREFAHLIARQFEGDGLRRALDALAAGSLEVDGQDQARVQLDDPRALRTLDDALRLADRTLVNSAAEYEVIRQVLPHAPPFVRCAPAGVDRLVPQFASSPQADAVVVWAPHLSPAHVARYDVALRAFPGPVIIVAHEPGNDVANIRYLPIGEAGSALSRARVIVDAATEKPATALAFAQPGCSAAIAVAATSGANEYLRGAFVYAPWDWNSLQRAVVAAFAAAPTGRAVSGAEHEEVELGPPAPADGPLVSVIAAAPIAAQTYRTIEVHAAADADAARGDYVVAIGAGTLVFPDHLALLAAALQRSGAMLASADVVAAYPGAGTAGGIAGYRVFSSNHAERASAREALLAGPLCAMYDRRAAGAGELAAAVHDPAARAALWSRVRTSAPAVHVAAVTSVHLLHPDRGASAAAVTSGGALVSARWPEPALRVIPPDPLP